MKIKWMGHSCFLMTSDTGVRILTDPFDAQVGYPVPMVGADIVTTSHSHFDHGYVQAVQGSFIQLNESGKYNHNGIIVTGVSTYHDEVEGKKRGRNIVFIFEIDGLRICHCGDLGHLPSKQQMAQIGRVDILLLPVGGTFTINGVTAYELVKLLNPAISIPMHYRTPVLSFPIEGVEKFLSEAHVNGHSEVFAHRQEVELSKYSLKDFPPILVLDYQ